jgi:hypothetical protein
MKEIRPIVMRLYVVNILMKGIIAKVAEVAPPPAADENLT